MDGRGMNARWLMGGTVMLALALGGLLYWSQVYAGFEVTEGGEMTLVSYASGAAEPIEVANLKTLDRINSPVAYRACFDMPLSIPALTETYVAYEDPVPLIAPGWFDCFDAKAVGAALEAGEAFAFLSAENVVYGIDRVVAVMPDGRGVAWHQINRCGEVVFDGQPAPEGCPPVPERD